MNWKTTIILALLAGAGAAGWYWVNASKPEAPPSPTRAFLEDVLKEDKLTRIEIRRGKPLVVLSRQPGQPWTLPSGRPVRQIELEQFLKALMRLRSRYEPLPLEAADLARYGLKDNPLQIVLRVDGKDYTLTLGEEPESVNRFVRATFLRLDQHDEVVRLGPGLIAALDHPQEHFQKRRLFDFQSLPERAEGNTKSEQLDAVEVTVAGPDGSYTLKRLKAPDAAYSLDRAAEYWELIFSAADPKDARKELPVRDRVDPDKLRDVLTGLTDFWADEYVDGLTLAPRRKKLEPHVVGLFAGGVGQGVCPETLLAVAPALAPAAAGEVLPAHLAVLGLLAPQESLSVAGPSGRVKLLIGKTEAGERKFKPPFPPGGQPPLPPSDEVVYAQLAGDPQIFEIHTTKWRDLLVSARSLRDGRLARFNSGDVYKIKISSGNAQGKNDIILVREKDGEKSKDRDDKDKLARPSERWRMLGSKMQVDAEKVDDLLRELSTLQVKDADILDADQTDSKKHGLDNPTVVVLGIEEGKKADKEPSAITTRIPLKRTVTVRFGMGEKDKGKLYARVDSWPRINVLDAEVWKVVSRPAIAYRQRRMLDFAVNDVARIEVKRDKDKDQETIILEQEKEKWRMSVGAGGAKPAPVQVESLRATMLADDLRGLEAAEFVADQPSKEELDKVREAHGLKQPSVLVKVDFNDAKKHQPIVVRLGKEKPDKKEHHFAQVNDGPIFLVRQKTLEAVAKSSLAYRDLQLWDVPAGDITELRIQKKGATGYELKREEAGWRIVSPFKAVLLAGPVQLMAEELADPRAEKYLTHKAEEKELKDYGLDDPPAFRATVTVRDAKDKKDKTFTLDIGKPVEKDGKLRYARRGDDPAVFTLSDKLAQVLDRTALELLDPVLLKLGPKGIDRIEIRNSREVSTTLTHSKDEWQVSGADKSFTPDETALQETLKALANLRVRRFADYGPKVEWDKFGLGKSAATTITIAADGKKHILLLGSDVPDQPGQRYARLEDHEGLAVLDDAIARRLDRSHLDFADRLVLKLDRQGVTGLVRKMGKQELELIRQKDDETWQFAKTKQAADTPTLEDLLDRLYRLRAARIAAYPASPKNLKDFGLEDPEAIVTLRMGEDAAEKVVRISKPSEQLGKKPAGERFAVVDKSETIFVLPAEVASVLTAGPLRFRDHNLASFSGADKAVVERTRPEPREVTFTKADRVWKMTGPVKADAEDTDLDDFLRGLLRLRAHELVEEKPVKKSSKTYGLDPPLLSWRWYNGDKEVLHLLVGKQKDGRAYARLAGGDMVFLLSPALTRQAEAEYRNRKVWNLDPVQADKLTYEYAGKKAFTLEKLGKIWIADQPDLKPDVKTITDTLLALADLKALRYVVDEKPNLQLFGLGPTPALTVKVHSSGGERVLHIGRQEGDSKGAYATVARDEGSPVFVIAEDDVRRIMRSLRDFAAMEKKQALHGIHMVNKEFLMRAMAFAKPGGVEVLELMDLPKPQIEDDEVLVQVRACGLNHLDIWVRSGLPAKIPMPHIGGCEPTGVVAEIGRRVKNLTVGQRVLVSPGQCSPDSDWFNQGIDSCADDFHIHGYQTQGGFAEYTKAKHWDVIPISEAWSFTDWAAVPLTFVTAWNMLHTKAKVQPNDNVVVFGASSGVGTAAIQIAKLAGARVLAIAGNEDKLKKAEQLGADVLINYNIQDIAKEVKVHTNSRGADIVFEHVGAAIWQHAMRCLGKNGRLVTCGATTGNKVELDLRFFFTQQHAVLGAYMGARHELLQCLRLLERRIFQPVVDSVFPLEKLRDAQQRMEKREMFGKIVVTP